jgi:hypothetical protein
MEYRTSCYFALVCGAGNGRAMLRERRRRPRKEIARAIVCMSGTDPQHAISRHGDFDVVAAAGNAKDLCRFVKHICLPEALRK